MTFNFGWLTFWDTRNPRTGVVLFVVAAFAALRMASPLRAAYACGMALGFAFVAKPPAACFFPIALLVAAGRYQGWRARGLALLRMGAASAVLPVIACTSARRAISGSCGTSSVDTLADVARVTDETLSWYGPYTVLAVALVVAMIWAVVSGRRQWVQR